MKHNREMRKLGRVMRQRRALLRSLAISLIEREHIKTTEAKAKELRRFIEPLVTKAKRTTLVARRSISSQLGERSDMAKKLIETIAKKYSDRPGGYTRIIKMAPRKGDGSPMAIIEFVR